jgi:hypothetical protein
MSFFWASADRPRAQTLAQLAFWGTPAYAPRVGGARLYIVDGLDGGVFRSRLQMSDLRTTRFLVVSKSGATTEPLMQTLAAIEALEEAGGGKYLKHHFAGITEDKPNPLRAILTEMDAPILPHDPDLGGRYAVFSVVGLLPALLAGLDARAIRAGARDALHAALKARRPPSKAQPNRRARCRPSQRHVDLPRPPRALPRWWRRLWAESPQEWPRHDAHRRPRPGRSAQPTAALPTARTTSLHAHRRALHRRRPGGQRLGAAPPALYAGRGMSSGRRACAAQPTRSRTPAAPCAVSMLAPWMRQASAA